MRQFETDYAEAYIPDNEELTLNQQALVYELRNWQDIHNLPHTSADEVDMLKLARSEREWLQDWIARWDAALV